MDKIDVRKLKPKDAKAAYALMKSILPELTHQRLYPKESIDHELRVYRPRRFIEHIKSSYAILIGAFEGKRVVGLSLTFVEYGGLINIDWLIVDCGYRRAGVGEKLLRYSEFLSKKRKMHRIYADTEMKNKNAITFFNKMGYTKIATLKDWNFHENRYVWAKELK